jgi:hypothetical protein
VTGLPIELAIGDEDPDGAAPPPYEPPGTSG